MKKPRIAPRGAGTRKGTRIFAVDELALTKRKKEIKPPMAQKDADSE
jgi:hypothetical protein